MQTFGKFATNFDHDYVTKHYIYINEKDEDREDIKINLNDLKKMLKKKSKTVAGTIFLYNPTISPIGFDNNSSLTDQGFEFNDEFHELNFNDMMNLFSKSVRDGYRGISSNVWWASSSRSRDNVRGYKANGECSWGYSRSYGRNVCPIY